MAWVEEVEGSSFWVSSMELDERLTAWVSEEKLCYWVWMMSLKQPLLAVAHLVPWPTFVEIQLTKA